MTRQSAAGVRKGIRQTEFCHYFRTRAFAGTERRDVLRLTQAEDLVGTAWWELRPIGASKLVGAATLDWWGNISFSSFVNAKGLKKYVKIGGGSNTRPLSVLFYFVPQEKGLILRNILGTGIWESRPKGASKFFFYFIFCECKIRQKGVKKYTASCTLCIIFVVSIQFLIYLQVKIQSDIKKFFSSI